MRFLANENFPAPSISILREFGYDVLSVSELYPGISDFDIVVRAQQENLIILTFDKDYGEIIYKYKRENPPAVVFFRFKGESPETAGKMVLSLIEDKGLRIEKTFTVVEKESIRQRTY